MPVCPQDLQVTGNVFRGTAEDQLLYHLWLTLPHSTTAVASNSPCSAPYAADAAADAADAAHSTGEDGSINSGSCMFGQLDGSKGTGWDIAALSDKNSDYSGNCQQAVQCR